MLITDGVAVKWSFLHTFTIAQVSLTAMRTILFLFFFKVSIHSFSFNDMVFSGEVSMMIPKNLCIKLKESEYEGEANS